MLQPARPAVFELHLGDEPREGGGAVDWTIVFGARRPLRVEIGVGVSTFLIEVAAAEPEFNYVGFEYSGKRVAKFLRKLESSGVQNIRMIRADVARCLTELFTPASIDWIYINHPDPWPKRRHGKKRFINPENASTLVRLLAAGGKLSLRTDFAPYARQMLAVLDTTPGLRNLAGNAAFASGPAVPITTYYEQRFLQAGQPIYYLEFDRAPDDGSEKAD